MIFNHPIRNLKNFKIKFSNFRLEVDQKKCYSGRYFENVRDPSRFTRPGMGPGKGQIRRSRDGLKITEILWSAMDRPSSSSGHFRPRI